MRLISSFIFVFILTGLSLANMTTAEIESYLIKMFDYANAHNIKALEDMKSEIVSKKIGTIVTAYSLALYIASPEKYKNQYIDNFPVTYEGIMYDLYELIELKQRTPKFLYSIESIGLIAQDGNKKAIEKVLEGTIHSDGVVSASSCDILTDLFHKQPRKTLKALSKLSTEQRSKEYSCFKLMNSEEFILLKKNLKKLKPASKLEKKVIQEIERYQY